MAKKGPTTKPLVRNKRKRTRSRRSRKKMASSVNSALTNYMKLLDDPCHGPLVRAPGFTDSVNVIERQRVTLTNNSANGYIIWFPSYQGAGYSGSGTGTYYPQNCFVYSAALTSDVPTNTVAAPLGAGGTGGTWVQDPSWTSTNGAIFSRSRTISACLQLEYLGALSAIKGQICMIGNMPLSVLNTATAGSTVGTLTFPSVDQVFAYAAVRERLDLAGHEVKYRPTDLDCKLRDDSLPYIGAVHAHGTVPDALFWGGSPTVQATVLATPNPDIVNGIVIAWRGATGVASDLSINLVKVSEFELAFGASQVEQPHRPIAGQGTISTAVDALFKIMPKWNIDTVIKAVDSVNKLRRAAATYAPGRYVRGTSAPLMIMDGGL